MYQMAKWDIAPRVGVAYASTTRPHFASALVKTSTTSACRSPINSRPLALPVCLAPNRPSPAGVHLDCPRFTGIHNIPLAQSGFNPPAGTITFPFLAPLQRPLPTLSTTASGRRTQHRSTSPFNARFQATGQLSRLRGPLWTPHPAEHRLRNASESCGPASGMDYFTAVDCSRISTIKVSRRHVQKIPYWEDLFPDAANPE